MSYWRINNIRFFIKYFDIKYQVGERVQAKNRIVYVHW